MKKNKMLAVFIRISIFSILLIYLLVASTVMAEALCLNVRKSWDGDRSLAPELVIVDVYNASNDEVVGIIYLSEGGNWEYTLCNLAEGEYYVQERNVSGFDTIYPNGNSVQVTSLNDQENPAEIEIVNEYAYPPRTFKLSIYDVTVMDDMYIVTVTVCADQAGGVDQELYFNDQKSADGAFDSEPITLTNKGECQQITFAVNIAEIDLNQIYYVGYPPQQWIEIGEPREFIPITTAKIADLDFGSFTAADGTIIVEPEGGLTLANGYSGYHAGNQQAAAVEVSWLPNAQYNISVPSNDVVITHDANNSMTVNNFAVDNNIRMLDASGYDIFNIGASLNITEGLEPGLYSGQFFVEVSFE